MKKLFLLAAASLVAVVACVRQEPETVSDVAGNELLGITVNLPDAGAFQTRSTFVIDDSGVHVLWAENDTLGILPNAGDQVYFPMSSGAGSSSAHFDGGAWGVKDANTYSSYFPFSRKYYGASHDAIRLDYRGQLQRGNADASHLAAVDFLASGTAQPQNNYLTLNLERLGSIACFKLAVPQPGTYTSAVVSSEADFVLTADLDVTGQSPVVTPVSTAHQLTLSLDGLTTTSAGETVTLYMMVSPVDLTGHSLQVTLLGEGVSCFASLTPKKLVAGKPYMFQASDVRSSIGFLDATAKRICVQNWDADGNGELDFDEAAAVTSIGTAFQGSGIASFDELRYFTSLNALDASAFKNCSRLASVTLPGSIQSLGNDVFYGCSNLRSMTLPEGLTEIPDMAFWCCSSLKSISIPSTVKRIGQYALDRCSSLESLALPEGLERLDYCALRGLKKVESIVLPAGITQAPCNIFDGWESLKSFTIPSSWTELPHCAFYGCKSLTAIQIPEGIRSIGHSCFLGCTVLASVSLPSTLRTVSSHAFQDCKALESIQLPEGCSGDPGDGYGNYGHFQGCSSLQRITLPGSWTDVGDDCFTGCSALQSFVASEGVAHLGERCLLGCSALNEVSLPQSLVAIESATFKGCSSLGSIVIPSRIKALYASTFEGCSSLTEVVLPEGLVSLGDYADFWTSGVFANCSQLETLHLPSSLRFIGAYAFIFTKLSSIAIPDQVQSIGKGAFERCPLQELVLPSSLRMLDLGVLTYTSLKKLTLGPSIEVIRHNLLPGSLESIQLMALTPPVLEDEKTIPDNGCPIIVPGESLEAYKTAPIWSRYASRMQASSDTGAENPNPGGWE